MLGASAPIQIGDFSLCFINAEHYFTTLKEPVEAKLSPKEDDFKAIDYATAFNDWQLSSYSKAADLQLSIAPYIAAIKDKENKEVATAKWRNWSRQLLAAFAFGLFKLGAKTSGCSYWADTTHSLLTPPRAPALRSQSTSPPSVPAAASPPKVPATVSPPKASLPRQSPVTSHVINDDDLPDHDMFDPEIMALKRQLAASQRQEEERATHLATLQAASKDLAAKALADAKQKELARLHKELEASKSRTDLLTAEVSLLRASADPPCDLQDAPAAPPTAARPQTMTGATAPATKVPSYSAPLAGPLAALPAGMDLSSLVATVVATVRDELRKGTSHGDTPNTHHTTHSGAAAADPDIDSATNAQSPRPQAPTPRSSIAKPDARGRQGVSAEESEPYDHTASNAPHSLRAKLDALERQGVSTEESAESSDLFTTKKKLRVLQNAVSTVPRQRKRQILPINECYEETVTNAPPAHAELLPTSPTLHLRNAGSPHTVGPVTRSPDSTPPTRKKQKTTAAPKKHSRRHVGDIESDSSPDSIIIPTNHKRKTGRTTKKHSGHHHSDTSDSDSSLSSSSESDESRSESDDDLPPPIIVPTLIGLSKVQSVSMLLALRPQLLQLIQNNEALPWQWATFPLEKECSDESRSRKFPKKFVGNQQYKFLFKPQYVYVTNWKTYDEAIENWSMLTQQSSPALSYQIQAGLGGKSKDWRTSEPATRLPGRGFNKWFRYVNAVILQLFKSAKLNKSIPNLTDFHTNLWEFDEAPFSNPHSSHLPTDKKKADSDSDEDKARKRPTATKKEQPHDKARAPVARRSRSRSRSPARRRTRSPARDRERDRPVDDRHKAARQSRTRPYCDWYNLGTCNSSKCAHQHTCVGCDEDDCFSLDVRCPGWEKTTTTRLDNGLHPYPTKPKQELVASDLAFFGMERGWRNLNKREADDVLSKIKRQCTTYLQVTNLPKTSARK